MRRSWTLLLSAVVLFLVAGVGAAMDVDFFNPADFLDASAPHHEHIIVFVAAAGLVVLLLAIRAFLAETAAPRIEPSSGAGKKV